MTRPGRKNVNVFLLNVGSASKQKRYGLYNSTEENSTKKEIRLTIRVKLHFLPGFRLPTVFTRQRGYRGCTHRDHIILHNKHLLYLCIPIHHIKTNKVSPFEIHRGQVKLESGGYIKEYRYTSIIIINKD